MALPLQAAMASLHRTLDRATRRTRVEVREARGAPPLLAVGPSAPPTASQCHAMLWVLHRGDRRAFCVTCRDDPREAVRVVAAIHCALHAMASTLRADAESHGPFDPVSAAARLHAALCRVATKHTVREVRCGAHQLPTDVALLHSNHHRVVDWVAWSRCQPFPVQVQVVPQTGELHGWSPFVMQHLRRVSEGKA